MIKDEYINSWYWSEYQELSSTNDKAMELSRTAPAGSRFAVTSLLQTNGRGRRGRHWESIEGNLFLSLGLETKIHKLGQLIAVISLSLAETIHKISSSANVNLKWPNDVLLNNKKVSGILIEKGEDDFLIIGIGVNVEKSPNIDGLIYPATSLKESNIHIDRLGLFKLYLDILDKNLILWNEDGFAPIKAAWINLAKGIGDNISVTQEGKATKGRFRGIDDNGSLLLDIDGIITKIYAGDVYYV